MTEEEFKALKPGTAVICRAPTNGYYTKNKYYVVRAIEGRATIIHMSDDKGHPDNGWHYKYFDISPMLKRGKR